MQVRTDRSLEASRDDESRTTTDTQTGPAESSHPEADLHDEISSEVALLLTDFADGQPDFVAWTDYLCTLALGADAHIGSARSDGSEFGGKLTVPGSDQVIDFTLSEEGYTIKIAGPTYVPSLGVVDFQSNLSGGVADGELGKVHCAVQFYPEGDGSHTEASLGYIYTMDDYTTAFGELTSDPDGPPGNVVVPDRAAYDVQGVADLAHARALWRFLLEQGELGGARRAR